MDVDQRYTGLVSLPRAEAYSPWIVDKASKWKGGKRQWRRASWAATMDIELYAELVELGDQEFLFLTARGETSMNPDSQEPNSIKERNFHDIVGVSLETEANDNTRIVDLIPSTPIKAANYEFESGLTVSGGIEVSGESDGSGNGGLSALIAYTSTEKVSTSVQDFELTAAQNGPRDGRMAGEWNYQLRQVYDSSGKPSPYRSVSDASELLKKLVDQGRRSVKEPAGAAMAGIHASTQLVVAAPRNSPPLTAALITTERVVHCRDFAGTYWLSYATRSERRPFSIDFVNAEIKSAGPVEVQEMGASNHPHIAAPFPADEPALV